MSTPSLRPIQFRCMGEDLVRPLIQRVKSPTVRRRSWVMRKNHCSKSRRVMGVSHRSHSPLSTCSLASTVWHDGHPHHGRLRAVGQALFVQLDEEPLVPAVVLPADSRPLPGPSRRSRRWSAVARRMFSTLDMVHSKGWMPRDMAAFSAGRPKASKPMGCSTLYPCIRRNRAWASDGAMAYQWPMCRSTGRVRVHGHFEPFRARVVVVHAIDPVPFPPLLPLAIDPDRGRIGAQLDAGAVVIKRQPSTTWARAAAAMAPRKTYVWRPSI